MLKKERGKKKKARPKPTLSNAEPQIPHSYKTIAQNAIANNKVEQLSVSCVLEFHRRRSTIHSEGPGLWNHSDVRIIFYSVKPLT